MSTDVTLEQQVMDLIASPASGDVDFLASLGKILEPVTSYSSSCPDFEQNITVLVDTIIKDRNGDNVFNLDDLKILGTDPVAIMELIKGIVLLVASMRELTLTYVAGVAETIVLKTLMYIFLVVVPARAGIELSEDEKRSVVGVVMQIFKYMNDTKAVQRLFAEVVKWFQKRNLCLCCQVQNDTQATIDANMPAIAANLQASVTKNRLLIAAKGR